MTVAEQLLQLSTNIDIINDEVDTQTEQIKEIAEYVLNLPNAGEGGNLPPHMALQFLGTPQDFSQDCGLQIPIYPTMVFSGTINGVSHNLEEFVDAELLTSSSTANLTFLNYTDQHVVIAYILSGKYLSSGQWSSWEYTEYYLVVPPQGSNTVQFSLKHISDEGKYAWDYQLYGACFF